MSFFFGGGVILFCFRSCCFFCVLCLVLVLFCFFFVLQIAFAFLLFFFFRCLGKSMSTCLAFVLSC